MPKHFSINKRLLTTYEKYKEAIYFYAFDVEGFTPVYLPDENDNMTDEEFDAYIEACDKAVENDDQDEIERLHSLHPYVEPIIDVDKTMELLDELTKEWIMDEVNKDMYEETITLKCLKCDHEETVDWGIVWECWDEDEEDYPTSYCPKCNKPKFVPVDIYNKKLRK